MTYFFIGGCPRSGTTLLQNILCSDKTVNPLIGEAGYLYHLVKAYNSGKLDFDSQSKYYFSDLNELQNFSASLIKQFLKHTLQRYAPATNLVLKYPLLAEFFPDIYESIDDVKFLVTVRDPRDTIASLIKVGDRLKELGQTRHFTPMFENRNIEEYLLFYKQAYQKSWNYRLGNFQDNIGFIKYEYLVLKPEEALEILKSFTGLKLDNFNPASSWQRSQINYQNLSAAEKPWYSQLYDRGISAAGINSYRQVLTEAEIKFIEREAADIFKIFQYQKTE